MLSLGLTVSSSVFTIAILSADRLLAIRQPMNFRIYRAGRHAWVIVAIVWIASVAVTSPLLIVRQLDVINLPSIEPVVFCIEVSSIELVDWASNTCQTPDMHEGRCVLSTRAPSVDNNRII